MTKLTQERLDDMLEQLEDVGIPGGQALQHVRDDRGRTILDSLAWLLAITQAKRAANALVDRLSI